ncbi:MAG: DUF2460 domain-containing protein [Pseudomonadota bacterium]
MFHEIQFPPKLSFGSVGGPERRTEIVTLANGFEERNTPWSHSRRRYDAGVALRSLDDLEELIAFFEARQGQMYGFRWKDWSDYRSVSSARPITDRDQDIADGDGETLVYQMQKVYRSGEQTYARPITKPRRGTVKVAVGELSLTENDDFTVDYTTGLITFADAPDEEAEITAGYEFDVPVRFDSSSLQMSLANFRAGDVPSVPIVEIRV